jgi:hypothetical protein
MKSKIEHRHPATSGGGYAARALFWLENDRILLLRVEPNNAGLNMLWIFSNALKSSKKLITPRSAFHTEQVLVSSNSNTEPSQPPTA